MFTLGLCLLVSGAAAFCGENIRWSHTFDVENVYGLWYGAGYAQHTPDMTDRPIKVGCVTLYITDINLHNEDDWLDWTIQKRNYTDQSWRSYKSNPWSRNGLSGSWLDVKINRRKRQVNSERTLRVIWDEDGQTMEQNYVYSTGTPGLWTLQQWRPGERDLKARGIEMWQPDNPPRHPEIIRVLKATPDMLIITHCSEIGSGGIFSLILTRSPIEIDRWWWKEFDEIFYNFEIPKTFRQTAVCAACVDISSIFNLLFSVSVLRIMQIMMSTSVI